MYLPLSNPWPPRMAGSPDKKAFLQGRMNIIDSLVSGGCTVCSSSIANKSYRKLRFIQIKILFS